MQQSGSRMLKTFAISLKEKELVKGPWEPINVEPQACLLQAVPLPLGGVVVVGADTISHHNQNSKVSEVGGVWSKPLCRMLHALTYQCKQGTGCSIM